MPRPRAARRMAKAWQPLPLSHDFTERAPAPAPAPQQEMHHEILQAMPQIMPEPVQTQRPGGLVVFIETIESMVRPPPLGDYTMDMATTNAAVIFYLKAHLVSPTTDNSQRIEMSRDEEIPFGTASILGSKLTVPNGPQHGQRMLYFKTSKNTFTIILWCSIAENWSHVATFQYDKGTVRAWSDPKDWNESTMLLINSHTSQTAAFCRLYKIGTGKRIHPEVLLLLPNIHDPFQRFLDAYEQAHHAYIRSYTNSLGTASSQRSTPPHTQDLHAVQHDANTYTQPAMPDIQPQYRTPEQQTQQYYYPPEPTQFGAVPWYSLPSYGAVQWPQERAMNNEPFQDTYGHYIYTADPYHPPATQYPGYYAPYNKSPITTRSSIRNTVMQMPEQAAERNKMQAGYRTVLHDPFREENTTPPAVQAASYTLSTPASARPPHPQTARKVEHFRQETAVSPSMPVASPLTFRHWRTHLIDSSLPDDAWHLRKKKVLRIFRPTHPEDYSRQNFGGPFFTDDLLSPQFEGIYKQPVVPVMAKNHDQAVNDWWWSGSEFSRHEDYHHSIVAVSKSYQATKSKTAVAVGSESDLRKAAALSRALVPVFENLESYITGALADRRGYWSRWLPAPEWCCDRSEQGSKSFFDKDWGCPPARIGRDSRYNPTTLESPYAGRQIARGGYATRDYHIGRDR